MANMIKAKIYKNIYAAEKYSKKHNGNVYKKFKREIKVHGNYKKEEIIPYYVVTVGDYK